MKSETSFYTNPFYQIGVSQDIACYNDISAVKCFSHFWYRYSENKQYFKGLFIYATLKKMKRLYVKQFNGDIFLKKI